MKHQSLNAALGMITIFLLSGFSATAHAGLIVNGNFEIPAVSITGVSSIGPGSEPLGFGWTINSGNVEVQGELYAPLPGPAFDGIRFLDLNGISIGTMSQSFATLPGNEYHLTFAYGNNYSHTNPSSPATASVSIFDTTSTTNLVSPITISHGSSASSNLDWLIGGTSFMATGTSTTLRFISTTSAPLGGILLDGVDVTGPISAPVPEPSSLSLLLLGAGTVALCSFRRRSQYRR